MTTFENRHVGIHHLLISSIHHVQLSHISPKAPDARRWDRLDYGIQLLTPTRTGPILLGCALPERNSVALIQYDNWKELPPHPEEHQIKLDVDRSFTHYNGTFEPKARNHPRSRRSTCCSSPFHARSRKPNRCN